MSDAEVNKRGKADYGSDWGNKKYMKDVHKISSTKDYRNMQISQIKKTTEYAKGEAAAHKYLADKYANADISRLSKKDMKRVSKYIDKAYTTGEMSSYDVGADLKNTYDIGVSKKRR